MSNSWKVSLQQATPSGMTTVLGLLKSGKLILRCTSDRDDPDETSWRVVRKVRPGHEEILLDGIAQSERNEETLRDRSGATLISTLKKRKGPQQFVIGNDETRKLSMMEPRNPL